MADMQDEIWKDIPGYDGDYQASNKGRIKSIRRIRHYIRAGKSVTTTITGGEMTYSKGSLPYYCVNITKLGGKFKTFMVHRLIALTFIPNPFNKPQVNHKDGNKLNNHVSNLEWATQSENREHARQNFLTRSKLTAFDVRSIRSMYSVLGVRSADLASMYGKTQQGIIKILNREYWNQI